MTLTNVMRLTDKIFIWSHFFDDAAMPAGDPRRAPFTGQIRVREYAGRRVTYHLRSYGDTTTQVKFIGGAMPGSVWLDRGETEALLQAEGFEVHVEFAHDATPTGQPHAFTPSGDGGLTHGALGPRPVSPGGGLRDRATGAARWSGTPWALLLRSDDRP